MVPIRLVSTAEAAKAVGVAPRTLQSWVRSGLVEPDLVTAGGHARWDVDRLRNELRELRERDD